MLLLATLAGTLAAVLGYGPAKGPPPAQLWEAFVGWADGSPAIISTPLKWIWSLVRPIVTRAQVVYDLVASFFWPVVIGAVAAWVWLLVDA